MVDHGYPFKKIMHGKKWVGRVYQHADGTWRGAINKTELSKASTPVVAFEEAVAKHLGYDNANALKRRNSVVRQHRKQQRIAAEHAVDKYLSAKTMDERFKALDEVVGINADGNIDSVDRMAAGFAAIERKLFK